MRPESQPDASLPTSNPLGDPPEKPLLNPLVAALEPFTPKAEITDAGLFDGDDLDIETKQRTGLRWILASGLVLVLGAGGWLGYRTWQGRRVEPVMVSTEAATRATLENRVDATGTVTLGNQQTLKAPGDVTVEAVLVNERQRVEKGAVLLRLRDRSLEQQLDEQLIQAEILTLQRQRQQEVLQDKQRDVQRAEARLTESQALLDQGFISEDDYDGDRNALETARSELREAEVSLQQSDLEMRKNQATLANVNAQIADNAIVAPFEAVVLNIDVQPGDGVPREGDLLTIGDPGQERILFDLMTLDANRVSINMPVRVRVIGPDPTPYLGRVISIAPQAVGEGQNRDGQAVVKAIAQLDRPSGTLIPGSSVSLEVIIAQRQNALAIPPGALQQDEGTPYVWVVDGNSQAQKRPVVIGLDTLDAVEIISGLSESDTIIVNLPPDQPLTEGTTVLPSTPDSPNQPPSP
ncbi:MAG: efflux RND transporter periplasmic adaptor subunit [Nodosilinea sp.]